MESWEWEAITQPLATVCDFVGFRDSIQQASQHAQKGNINSDRHSLLEIKWDMR